MFSGDNATHLPPSVKVWRKSHKAFNSELLEKWRVYKAFSICEKLWKALKNELSINGECGSRMLSTKEGFVEVLEFTHFARIFKFNRTLEIGKKKEISHEIKVSVVMELV